MKYYYDLHIHSCLSPCGDMDMTPNNLVNMAKLLGLDVIALTDHNTSLNCEAAMAVGRISTPSACFPIWKRRSRGTIMWTSAASK